MNNEITPKDANALLSANSRGMQKLKTWVESNTDTFSAVMEKLADEAPAKYADIYLRALQISSSASQQKTPPGNTLNVQINKLDTLSDVTDTSWRKNKSKHKIQDTPYEEIN